MRVGEPSTYVCEQVCRNGENTSVFLCPYAFKQTFSVNCAALNNSLLVYKTVLLVLHVNSEIRAAGCASYQGIVYSSYEAFLLYLTASSYF